MSSSQRSAPSGVILIIAASICFGMSGPFAKSLIVAGFTPYQVTWFRIVGTGIILFLAAIPVLTTLSKPPIWGLLVFGLAAIAGVQAFYFVAVSRLPVGIALLLEFTGPILVVLWIRFVRKTRLPRNAVVGTLVSVAGLAIVVQIWAGLRLDSLGLAAGAAAAACQAIYFLLGERLTGQVNTRAMLTIGFGVGAVALTPLAQPWDIDWALLSTPAFLGDITAPAWMIAVVLIAATSIAYLTGIAALRQLSAPIAGAMAYTEVVVASVSAWLLLGELLTLYQIIGGLIVIIGVFTAQRAVTDRAITPESIPEPTTTS